MKEKKYPVAFQVWQNGGMQKSAFHWSTIREGEIQSDCENFIEKHNNSGTFATLYVCHSEEELEQVLQQIGYYD